MKARGKEEILNDELSELYVEKIDEGEGTFRKWIYDAMEEYAKEYHENKNLLFEDKFVVQFSGGEFDDYYEYVVVISAKEKDDIEYKLLDILKKKERLKDGGIFKDFKIYTLNKWIEESIITL